jgi:uncharacterized protein (TIGR02246 family)
MHARSLSLVAFLFVLGACSSDDATAPDPVDRPAASVAASDSLAVRAVIARLDAAWGAMDATAFSKEFASDAQFVNILGQTMNGQAEVLARHQFLFGGPFKGSKLQSTIARQRFLGPVSASVETDAQLTGYVALPPGARETSPGVLRTRFLHVLQKVDGIWVIKSATNTAVAPS